MKKIIQLVAFIILMMLTNLKIHAQASSTIHTYSSPDWVGWISPTQTIDFGYDPGSGIIHTMKLVPSTGDLNLINGTTGPVHTNAYQIGGESVLWHGGDNTSIFVGASTGYVGSPSPPLYNTFVGNGIGALVTTASGNTSLGYSAGAGITGGLDNVAVGNNALVANLELSSNVALGAYALQNQNWVPPGGLCPGPPGCVYSYNVGVGFYALWATNPSAIIGPGSFDADGSRNSALGTLAGQTNITGSNNLYLGYMADAGVSITGLNNSSAIGANAKVLEDNTMILGEEHVRVGVGRSNAAVIAKLDVLSSTPDLSLTPNRDVPIAGNFIQTGEAGAWSTNFDYWAVYGFNDVKNTGNAGYNFGGDFHANNGDVNIGGMGSVRGDLGGVNNVGLWGRSLNNDISTSVNIGVMGESKGNLEHSITNIGVWGTAGDATEDQDIGVGVRGWALNTKGNRAFEGLTKGGVNSYGLHSTVGSPANGAGIHIGVYSDVGPTGFGIPAGAPVGVYGAVPNTGIGTIAIYGDLGIPACGPPFPCPIPTVDFAGYFNGDVMCTTGNYLASDESLKNNIQEMEDAMNIINQLHPKSYSYDQEGNLSMQLANGTHFGLIAQELEEVLPQLVKQARHPARYDSTGENEVMAAINFKAINYTELIPFLIAGMKQQQEQIAELQSIVNSHHASPPQNNEEEQNNSEPNQSENKPVTHIDLNSQDAILYQNTPNPFGSECTINVYLPQNIVSAKMIFMDEYGQVIKETELSDRGNASVVINSANLANGIYSYSLIVNGNVKDTKKMVRNK